MNKKQKELVKIFIFVWVLASVVINWNSVAWLFNYRVTSTLVADFFNPYQSSVASANTDASATVPVVTPKELEKMYPYTPKNNSIEIAPIGIIAPVVIGESTDTQKVMKELDRGAVLYPGSVLPGKNGQTIILGHSAPEGWPKIKHDWVFSDINDLVEGQIIVVNFNSREYSYKVTSKSIIQAGEELKVENLTTKNTLVLVSCWPPGKNYKRITVQAELL